MTQLKLSDFADERSQLEPSALMNHATSFEPPQDRESTDAVKAESSMTRAASDTRDYRRERARKNDMKYINVLISARLQRQCKARIASRNLTWELVIDEVLTKWVGEHPYIDE